MRDFDTFPREYEFTFEQLRTDRERDKAYPINSEQLDNILNDDLLNLWNMIVEYRRVRKPCANLIAAYHNIKKHVMKENYRMVPGFSLTCYTDLFDKALDYDDVYHSLVPVARE